MNRKRNFMPNDAIAATNNISRPAAWFPIKQIEDQEQGISLAGRLLIWTGFAMAQPDHPRGWQWNPATIVSVLTFMIVIAALIAGGAYYMGQQAEQNRQIMDRLRQVEQDAAESKKFSIYAAAGADEQNGHKPNQNKNKQENK